jgi:hypothetical protein
MRPNATPDSADVPRCAAGPTGEFFFMHFCKMKAAGAAVKVLHYDGYKCAISYFSKGDIMFLTFRMAYILSQPETFVKHNEGKKLLAIIKLL